MNGIRRRARPGLHTAEGRHAGFERFRRVLVLGIVCTFCLINGANSIVSAASPAKQAEKVEPVPTHAACAQVTAGRARCLADVSIGSFNDPAQAVAPNTSGGYGPAEFHTAYRLPCTPGGPIASVCAAPDSFGPQTIAIVDAGSYGASGALESALQTYDDYYGLPACTAANGCLNIVNQSGAASPLPPNVSSGWSSEIALDVESAHMICQTCKIVLVEADDDYTDSLSAAEVTAASFSPIAISNSWGADVDQTAYDNPFKHSGIAVVAATGDNGTLTGGQSWPADIPEVVSAAGSTLQLNTDNTWAGETLWSGSGGGCSVNYTAPSWQTSRGDWASHGCGNGGRAFGDLAADANPSTGAAIAIGSSWYIIGGTSLSAPLIASMYALANDLPSGTGAVTLPYQNVSSANSHDITSGNDCTGGGQQNCTASNGFDVPSGLGAPNGLGLFQSGSSSSSYTSQLTEGATLYTNQSLGSSTTNPAYRLIMQGDGNLVVYNHSNKPVWQSGTHGSGANKLVVQGDGNLVLYTAANKPVWNSETTDVINNVTRGSEKLIMQGDGNLVLYNYSPGGSKAEPSWSTYTGKIDRAPNDRYNTTFLTLNKAGSSQPFLYTNQAVASSSTDPAYRLILQGDGNLVVYNHSNKPVWQSGTHGSGASKLLVQGDGNLVLYTAANKPVWNSQTFGNYTVEKLFMQSDGNLVLYDTSSAFVPLWSSYTGRLH